MNDTTLSSDNPLRSNYKITVSKNIKTIHNKIEQNKTQYNLDGQTANISALLPKNVDRHKFLRGTRERTIRKG